MIVWQYLRGMAFYVGFASSAIVWGPFSCLVGLCLPYDRRHAFVIRNWVGFVLWWLKICCGISVSVEGLEQLQNRAGILLVRHQSTWDALFAQMLVTPATTVIKQGLLSIPFFGWAFWVTRPIVVKKRNRASTLRQLLDQGQVRLQQGIWVTLFPEGARMGTAPVGDFQPGGAMLAERSGVPVYIVAHNGGQHWPRHGLRKLPGEIKLTVSAPLHAKGKTAKQINAEAFEWMKEAMDTLDCISTESDAL